MSASASPIDGPVKQGDVTDIERSRTSDNASTEDTDVDNGPWVTLDDGTGLLRVSLAPVCEAHVKCGEPWNAARGMYVLVLAVLEIEEPDFQRQFLFLYIKFLQSFFEMMRRDQIFLVQF